MAEFLPVGLELDGGTVRVSIWDGQKPGHIPGASEFPALVGIADEQFFWGAEAQKLQLKLPDCVLTLEECLAEKALIGAGLPIYTGAVLLENYWIALHRTLEARLEMPCSIECIAVPWQISYHARILLSNSLNECCYTERTHVVDSAACILYQYQHHTNFRFRGAVMLCHLGAGGAELTLAKLDSDTLEILNSVWMPDCSAQAIQNELAELCLILTRQSREQLPHLLQQLRYQFGALAAVDGVTLYGSAGPTEISRQDVLNALEKRLPRLSLAFEALCTDAVLPEEGLGGVLLSGALAALPGVEDTLSPVFEGRPIVLEGGSRAADGACLIAAKRTIALPPARSSLLLNCAGTDCYLMEVDTGRILATIPHWATFPIEVEAKELTRPGAAYQVVLSTGEHELEVVPPGPYLAEGAVRLAVMIDVDHNIHLQTVQKKSHYPYN